MNRLARYFRYGCSLAILFVTLHIVPFVGLVVEMDKGNMYKVYFWLGLFCLSNALMLVLVAIMTAHLDIGTKYDIKRRIQETKSV